MTQADAIIERLARAVQAGCDQNTSDFDLLAPGDPRPKRASLRDAAVLVGLIERPSGLNVILTKRPPHLKHHPGQVAFPGGKRDHGDASLVETALREADEEIGLAAGRAEVIGTIARHETVTGFSVVPVLARLDPGFAPVARDGEVETIFEVPFDFLMTADAMRAEARRWQGQMRSYYAIPYGPYYIWGATARMIVGLRDVWEQSA